MFTIKEWIRQLRDPSNKQTRADNYTFNGEGTFPITILSEGQHYIYASIDAPHRTNPSGAPWDSGECWNFDAEGRWTGGDETFIRLEP